jgi:hypothetical protein
LTISILDLGTPCKEFADKNKFVSIDPRSNVTLLGLKLLDSSFRTLPNRYQLLERHVDKIPGKVGWTYLLDTCKCRLYCEIDYPDYGGN